MAQDKENKKIVNPIPSLEFCLDNKVFFMERRPLTLEDFRGAINVPVCVMPNPCRYHGQKLPNGMYICDYALSIENEIKKASYKAGGENVRKQREN